MTTTNDNGQPEIVIQPANPQMIYLPNYDPAYIWGPPLYYPYASWYYPGRLLGFRHGHPDGIIFWRRLGRLGRLGLGFRLGRPQHNRQ